LDRRRLIVAVAALLGAGAAPAARAQGAQVDPQFDHRHAAWDALLGHEAGIVDARTAAVGAYLKSLSAVAAADFTGWTRPQQYAFLANAYNAFTVEKILTRWPDLKSIRDFGSVFGNPWKDRFFTLLGKAQHLDGIEHETMRAAGSFDEPRVHVAVNCASIGCPLLDRRALVGTSAAALDAQLEDLMRRFLADRARNRFDPQTKSLELSRIFDWYADDFRKGGRSFLGYAGFASVAEVGARYADLLADSEADRTLLRSRQARIVHLDYDWSLNAVGR
jgi:hypothetical protein